MTGVRTITSPALGIAPAKQGVWEGGSVGKVLAS